MIRFLEEITYNAWPALHTCHYDGWVLRFAEGYTRRANSVNPVYPSTLNLDEKIAYCEGLYTGQRQNTVFKMTSAAQPAGLDAILAERGYTKDALTSVQVLDDLAAIRQPGQNAVTIEHELTETWLDAFCRLNNIDARHAPTMKRMLGSIMPQTCFMAIQQDGASVAVGLGVLERGYVGVYDIVTAAPFRRQGLSTQLMLSLLHWGKANGVTRAYLQVMLNNDPALRLYAGIGFLEVYQYWYRIGLFAAPALL